ncbi:histidine phosphatase family protein [Bacillus alkalicellulosilyticus]|uniref:histidine phosphatase family protein n=1 Tax=Alkalihalobacterium alkalicellulosilyticum TaxID=1912214 RepID=UPI0009972851|nr:histidine phosphatase family protein [Bacillus alkalicellulosilyticus]
MKVILIRHGKSEKSGGGQVDIPLSDLGAAQADKVGQFLHEQIDIDIIYSSPLKRALHTAETIANTYDIPVQIDPLLMERTDGIFDGYNEKEREEKYPAEWLYFSEHPLEAAPNGESLHHLEKRVDDVVARIVNNQDSRTVAIVSHGEWLNVFLHKVLNIPWYMYPVFKLKPASATMLSFKKSGKTVVHYINRI